MIDRLRRAAASTQLQSPFDRRSLPIYCIIAFNIVAGIILLHITGMTFAREYWSIFLGVPFMIAGSGLMARRIGQNRLADFLELLGLVYAQGSVTFMVIIPIVAFSWPYADPSLAWADAALGFDWKMIEEKSRSFGQELIVIYRSFTWQPGVVVAALVIGNRADRAWQFVTSGAIALAITIYSFPLAPAQGPFVFYEVPPSNPLAAFWAHEMLPVLHQVKAEGLREIPVTLMGGLIAFPSYHAAAALLFVWAVWPFPILRWSILVLNAVMLLSCLTIGSHYLIDLIVGILVGVLAIFVSTRLRYRDRDPRPILTSTSTPA